METSSLFVQRNISWCEVQKENDFILKLHKDVFKDQLVGKVLKQRRKPRHFLRMISCHCLILSRQFVQL